jgi:FKBP-type peptidyl-prolyl cis-trans isomerase
MKNLFILLAGLVVLASCNTNYEKAKSGLRYKIIKGKGGKQLKAGDYLQYHQILAIPERDTIISSTYGKMHVYTKLDTGAMTAYTPLEIFPKLRVGDSVIIVFSADSLVKRRMAEYSDIVRRGSMLTMRIKITNSYSSITEVQAVVDKERLAEEQRLKREAAEQGKKDQADMDEYIRKNKINAIKTPSGAYVEIQQKGTGKAGDTGAIAQVYYTGKLLKDGTVFDSNLDPKFQHTMSFDVELGRGGVAVGFGEGLMYFGKGGRGKIYVPAYLGYGSQGNGPIPPNAPLLFEVEIRDILPPSAGAPHPNFEEPHH